MFMMRYFKNALVANPEMKLLGETVVRLRLGLK